MDCGQIVAVDSAVLVAVRVVSLHVDGEQSLGTIALGDTLVEGPFVGRWIASQSLATDQLSGEIGGQPLVVADEEQAAPCVSYVARLALGLRVATGARLADALETLAA